MATALTSRQLADLAVQVADAMIAGKDELTRLDADLGDGDLGRTVTRGFEAVKATIKEADPLEPDTGRLLFQLGKDFGNAAPSSFGALFGTALMAAGKSLRGKTAAGLSDLTEAAQAALDTLMERGGARPGDKTMLDALQPAVTAMRATLEENGDVAASVFFAATAQAAQLGAEATVNMQSQVGRASWQQARSAGKMDPGARAVAMMMAAAAQFFAGETPDS